MLNSNALTVSITKPELKYLLHGFELNIFKHLYLKGLFNWYKETRKPFLKVFLKTEKTLCKETSERMFNEFGLRKVLDEFLQDKRYSNIYNSYSLILECHNDDSVPILVNDLKLLLEISNITPKELKEFSQTFK